MSYMVVHSLYEELLKRFPDGIVSARARIVFVADWTVAWNTLERLEPHRVIREDEVCGAIPYKAIEHRHTYTKGDELPIDQFTTDSLITTYPRLTISWNYSNRIAIKYL